MLKICKLIFGTIFVSLLFIVPAIIIRMMTFGTLEVVIAAVGGTVALMVAAIVSSHLNPI